MDGQMKAWGIYNIRNTNMVGMDPCTLFMKNEKIHKSTSH